MSQIELYAELLTNIRTVTLVASLRTATNKETRVELSDDGQTITIKHEGISASLRLPTQMSGGGTAALTLPPGPSKDLTVRLKVEETAPGLLMFEHNDENLIPWPATAMEDAADIRCVKCRGSLVEMSNVAEWRDLPSENWAEMMDFWHCHKPHEHEEHGANEAVGKKGYSASNKLTAKTGLGYAGLSYFILAAQDCKNVEVKNDPNASTLHCGSCDLNLGIIDPAIEGWKLYKWSLSIVKKEDSATQSFSVPKWISTSLLATVENSGIRRFVVEPAGRTDGASDGLLLWLFTDSLSFSSSHMFFTRRDPTRAMKILWKPVDNASELLDTHHFSHEHLVFPPHVYDVLKQTLGKSQYLLPKAARKFQDWNIGLLERFSWEDVSGGDATVLPGLKSPPPPEEDVSEEDKVDAREAIRRLHGSSALLE